MSEHETARDLLGAWALDAVDDVERAAVERAIRTDPALADEARALRETVARLATSDAMTPPPALRRAVLDDIAGTRQRGAAVSRAGSVAPARRMRSRWLAVAAGVALALAVPTGLAFQQADRADRAEQQVETIADALSRPGAQLLGADVAGGGRAVAVVADGVAVFSASELPELDDARDYQLWVVDDSGARPEDVMRPDGGRVSAQVDGFRAGQALAVTVEPAGGSQQPTTDPVVVLAADA